MLTEPDFEVGLTEIVVSGGYHLSDRGGRTYDVMEDGRFLRIKPVEQEPDDPVRGIDRLQVVQNWFAAERSPHLLFTLGL